MVQSTGSSRGLPESCRQSCSACATATSVAEGGAAWPRMGAPPTMLWTVGRTSAQEPRYAAGATSRIDRRPMLLQRSGSRTCISTVELQSDVVRQSLTATTRIMLSNSDAKLVKERA